MSKIYKGKIRGVDCILIKSGKFQGNCVSFSKLLHSVWFFHKIGIQSGKAGYKSGKYD